MPEWVESIIRVAIAIGFVLTTVLVLIWLERKVIGHIQQRLGPMRTGFHGFLQSPADAVKLLVKEDIIPAAADRWAFQLAPALVFVPIFLTVVSIPFTRTLVVRNLDLGLFYVFAISSISIVGIVMAGWASGNKYALLGSVRAGAQMVSYEIPLVFSILGVAMVAGSLNLETIVDAQRGLWYIVLQPVGMFIFLVASLAELNRTPFDIPVAESEVVGGPYVEYSGIRWGVFFLSEYANTFIISALAAVVFLAGWRGPLLPGWLWFLIKTYAIILIIFWFRATLPRLRIDQLMTFAWKLLLPLAFVNLLITGLYLVYDWPRWILFVASVAVLAVASRLVYVVGRA
ncbi:MAG: NADH-quinone oxidoreductase subunit NuoH [Chloroflexi bacterium]|nr:NADH-quinone oxidoreductase subunit NuoH [Chloroflexota bacterium]